MHVKVLNVAGPLLQPPTSERLKSGYVILKHGEEVGEHRTDDREEMLISLQGRASITCESETVEVDAISVVYIPRNARHNVMNKSSCDLKYIYLVTSVI